MDTKFNEKINSLINQLKKIGIEGARKVEETLDEQYLALKLLYEKSSLETKEFVILATLNALVSFQLSCKAEKYWKEFSQYFILHELRASLTESLKEFLMQSQCNRRYLALKLKRLEKARYLESYLHIKDLTYLYEHMLEFWRIVAKAMKQEPRAKTVVFSVKIFGYAMRIATQKFVAYPMQIPIPEDSRIKKVSHKLGITSNIQAFWQWISEQAKLPSLHIDSILWNLLEKDEQIISRKLSDSPKLVQALKVIKGLLS